MQLTAILRLLLPLQLLTQLRLLHLKVAAVPLRQLPLAKLLQLQPPQLLILRQVLRALTRPLQLLSKQ